jgi:hypothetical protein
MTLCARHQHPWWVSRGGALPGGCAHDPQPSILPLDRVELELEELGDVPDEGEDLSHTVVDGRHRREEIYDRPRDRLCSLCLQSKAVLGKARERDQPAGTQAREGVTQAQGPTNLYAESNRCRTDFCDTHK